MPALAHQASIRDAREKLVRLLETGGFQGSLKNHMTVVFDGQPDIWYPKSISAVRVVFSCKETADDLIKRLVEEGKNPKILCVITDDRALQQAVRILGAKILKVSEFFGRSRSMQKCSIKEKSVSHEKNISAVTQCRINDELKKLWIE
jgi:predicted RNA-binding protein with PIN domain